MSRSDKERLDFISKAVQSGLYFRGCPGVCRIGCYVNGDWIEIKRSSMRRAIDAAMKGKRGEGKP